MAIGPAGGRRSAHPAGKIGQRATFLETLQTAGEALKAKRRATPRKITIPELPEAERPRQLLTLAKTLTHTVKMIAYRAETALVDYFGGISPTKPKRAP